MAGCCGPKSRPRCLSICGSVLLVVGAVIGGCWLFIFDAIVHWQLNLTPSSTMFKMWEDIPIPIYMEFTLFNVTNAAQIEKDPSTIPEVVELGPYVYREYHKRVNITWNDHNNTITYRQYRTYHFQPDRSKGSLTDMVTNYNVIATTAAFGTRFLPALLRLFVSRLMDKTNSTLLVTRSAAELLFDAYDDPLLDVATQLNSSLFTIPFTRFAYFAERNNSYEYDGWFNMNTGKDDLKKLGLHNWWNFETHQPFYGFPCNKVRGSAGDVWPPVDDYRDAEIFVPDLCLTLKLPFAREMEALGVPGLQYEATARSLDNGQLFPETRCHCLGECVPSGAINVSLCRWNAPLVLSLPHFHLADPVYLNYSKGLQPDPDKHTMAFALNPATGIPLLANARFQLSLMLDQFPNIRLFEKTSRRWVPMLWFNQRVEITEELAPLLKLLLAAPQIGGGVFFALAAAGALLLLAALLLHVRPTWEDPDEAAPLLLAAEDDPAARPRADHEILR